MKLAKIMKGEEKLDAEGQYENIKRIEKEMTKQDVKFIMSCLKSHFVFYSLSESDL